MPDSHRDIIFLMKGDHIDYNLIKSEVKNINYIIACVEKKYTFCKAHELVDRNYITNNYFKILSVIEENKKKPFRFLLNKN